MPRILYLLRHAKSDWNRGTASDFERPLSERGVTDASRMATWLSKQDNVPTTIISSPALRAYQTALTFSHALDIEADDIRFDNLIYAASLNRLQQVVRAIPACDKSVLLVGHNPGLDQLLQVLCKDAMPRNDGKLMTTCALAKIAVECEWQEISDKYCQLHSLSRPKEINIL